MGHDFHKHWRFITDEAAKIKLDTSVVDPSDIFLCKFYVKDG